MAFVSAAAYQEFILVIAFAVPLAMVALAIAMLRSLERRKLLARGLVYIMFLPEKRRRFLWLFTLFATFFVLSGIVDAISGVGLVGPTPSLYMSTVTFVGGGLCLFLLIATSLHPGQLTVEEQATLDRLPKGFFGLAFAPLEPGAVEPTSGP